MVQPEHGQFGPCSGGGLGEAEGLTAGFFGAGDGDAFGVGPADGEAEADGDPELLALADGLREAEVDADGL